MKHIITMAIACALISIKGYSQNISASAITHSTYLNNPKVYTSKIAASKINSKVLIDRSIYSSTLLNVNGYDKVTSINNTDWARMYNNLKDANSDSIFLPTLSKLEEATDNFSKSKGCYLLGLLNFDAKRISANAISSGQFFQDNNFLVDKSATSASFENVKVFAASCMKSNLFGDDINFMFPGWLNISNSSDLITSIEVDFGNGNGYHPIAVDQLMTIHYSNHYDEYIEIKMKVNYKLVNQSVKTLYARFSTLRQTSYQIPATSNGSMKTDDSTATDIPLPDSLGYYPVGTDSLTLFCPGYNGTNNCININKRTDEKIEYAIVLNQRNNSGMLRKPFIICDGFDYGNKRNYFNKTFGLLDHLLNVKEDLDPRGLYKLANGDLSPWSKSGDKSAHLMDSLRKDGYDLIFVNFLDGTDDIRVNAKFFREFLKNVLNKNFRDNKTEEAIVVGPSMGGLITRIALKEMENAKEDHFVKIWISFDSPQQGANIPIALQHNIRYGEYFNVYGKDFKEKSEMLKSDAAQQLLLHHYTMSDGVSHPTKMHIDLFNYLDTLGYPKLSKNYAITNGGKSALYQQPGIQIVKFRLLSGTTYLNGWSQNNSAGTFQFADNNCKENPREIVKSESQIPLDNAAGGWHSGINSINLSIINDAKGEINPNDINMKWACFIPTTSAMGTKINNTSVLKTWESYTNCNDNKSGKIKTPFDEIHGMETNEEHVKISPSTAFYIVKEFRKEVEDAQRPLIRNNSLVNQSVSGAVAYTIKDTIQFSRTTNKFTFNAGSDVNIRAGKSIQFHEGFYAKPNSRVSAKIVPVNYDTIQSIASTSSYKTGNENFEDNETPVFMTNSPFHQRIYNYSINENTLTNENIITTVSPNPTEGICKIEISGTNGHSAMIEVINSIGLSLSKNIIYKDGSYSIDLSNYEGGIYFIRVQSENSKSITRLVKF